MKPTIQAMRAAAAALLCFNVLFVCGAAMGQPMTGPGNRSPAVLCRLQPGLDPVALAREYGAAVENSAPGDNLYRFRVPDGQDPDAFAARLGQDPRFAAAENYAGGRAPEAGSLIECFPIHIPFEIIRRGSVRYASLAAAYESAASLAADPAALRQVGLGASWGVTRGAGVIVAVLDTGVQADHPGLISRLLDGYNALAPDVPPNEQFFESPGGSLIQSRATHPDIVERVAVEDDIRTFRISPSTLGDGYVECIANATLIAIRDSQPLDLRGTAVLVPVLEANGTARIGRFGWKSQHASLESFSADAYLNEMGITSPLFPEENTSSGRYVGFGSGFDPVPEVEDDGEDVVAFANFMRSTKAPSRGPITADARAGEPLFNQIGCATCHTPALTTARPGTRINGGAFTVPRALGNKIIRPYSDFLMHNIGTGDGIPVLPLPEYAATAHQIRTATRCRSFLRLSLTVLARSSRAS